MKPGDENLQCSECFVPLTRKQILRCSACKTAIYCGKECQKAQWPTHRQSCAVGQHLRTQLRAEKERDIAAGKTGRSKEDINKDIKKWCLINRDILDLSALQALELDFYPNNVFTQFLDIDVSYASPEIRRRSPKGGRTFVIDALTVQKDITPFLWATYNLSHVIPWSQDAIAKGGVGVAVYRVTCETMAVWEFCTVSEKPKMRTRVPGWESTLKKAVVGDEDPMYVLHGAQFMRLDVHEEGIHDVLQGDHSRYCNVSITGKMLVAEIRSDKDPSYGNTCLYPFP